jgi:hypothetical protein
MYTELITQINNRLVGSTGKISTAKIRSKSNSDLIQSILASTSFLDNESSITERIYCIRNDITAPPVCIITNTPLRYNNNTHCYNTANQHTPRNKAAATVLKFKNTITNRHSDIVSNLITIYTSNSYNLKSVSDTKKFIRYFKQTHKNIKPTLITKYTDNICSVIFYTDRGFLKGNYELKLFGERCYLIMKDLFEAPCCIDDSNTKAHYENYNVGYRKITTNKNRINLYNNIIKEKINSQGFIINNSNEIYNLKDCEFNVTCVTCNITQTKCLTNGRWKDIYCSGCYGKVGRSKQEDEIVDYIKSVKDIEIITNYKLTTTGKELDIYIPDLKVGIEYNGIVWHSYGKTHPNNIKNISNKFHINEKRLMCNKLGIRVINIFDSEWLFKKDIVKSMISSKLHLPLNTIFARKCTIQQIDKQTKGLFLKNNHIQGNDNSGVCLGLFYNNEIVSVMTFGTRKITGKVSFELIRFCNKINTHIPGSASKLFKHFLKNIWQGETIVTYADLRFSEGVLYNNLGFTFKHDSSPNYFYTKDCLTLENRVNYQKHKLATKLESFNELNTELCNMLDNGYRIIYDCGNKVYEYRLI